MIGFTDNHAAEALFSTIFMAIFLLAVSAAKESHISYNIRDIKAIRKPIAYAVLAGIYYAAYQLVWAGAALFALIIMIYAAVQFSINNARKESSDYLSIVGIITFAVSSILVYPAINPETGFSMYHYSWFILVVTLGAVAGFICLTIIEKILSRYNTKWHTYSLALLGYIVFCVMFLYLLSPTLYTIIMSAPDVIFKVATGGPSTIAEGSSIFYPGGTFSLLMACGNFTTAMFLISLLGIIVLFAAMIRKPKDEEIFILVWSAMTLLAIYGQNRFAYYYSINVAILGAYIAGILMEYAKYDKLKEFKGIRYITVNQVVVFFIILMFMIIPEAYSTRQQLGGSVDPNNEWYESCEWLRYNTPDPGLDFNATLEPPQNGKLFAYPETAYGVMSWWDYGHYIEVIGHRMPNANPFQAGVGGRRGNMSEINIPGAASFFTASSETEATDILDRIDPRPGKYAARYIMSDVKMATDIFMAMPEWTLDTSGYMEQQWTGSGYQYIPAKRYYESMEAKLHIFDGNGLQQYRLVHESIPLQSNEVAYKEIYNMLFGGDIRAENTGYVKIFEFVPGAHIVGNATPNTSIYVQTVILTNQKREIIYRQDAHVGVDGWFDITVPYSTTGPIKGETQFDTMPVTHYEIYNSANELIGLAIVPEEAVLSGDNIEMNGKGVTARDNTTIRGLDLSDIAGDDGVEWSEFVNATK